LDPDGHSDDITLDIGTTGDLAVAAASVRGNSHRLDGTRCEDAFHIAVANAESGPILVAVIGDGVGNARYSAFGSRKATQLFCSDLTNRLSECEQVCEETIVQAAADSLANTRSLVKEWTSTDLYAPVEEPQLVSASDLETTLTYAVVPAVHDEAEGRRATIGWIGDSPAFVLSSGHWRNLTDPGDEPVLDSLTHGLHSAGAAHIATMSVRLEMGDMLLLASDGFGNYITHGEKTLAVGAHLATRWQRPVEPADFIRDLTFDMAGADDDRTAVACWCNRTAPET